MVCLVWGLRLICRLSLLLCLFFFLLSLFLPFTPFPLSFSSSQLFFSFFFSTLYNLYCYYFSVIVCTSLNRNKEKDKEFFQFTISFELSEQKLILRDVSTLKSRHTIWRKGQTKINKIKHVKLEQARQICNHLEALHNSKICTLKGNIKWLKKLCFTGKRCGQRSTYKLQTIYTRIGCWKKEWVLTKLYWMMHLEA